MSTAADLVETTLARADDPMPPEALQAETGLARTDLDEALGELLERGAIVRGPAGYWPTVSDDGGEAPLPIPEEARDDGSLSTIPGPDQPDWDNRQQPSEVMDTIPAPEGAPPESSYRARIVVEVTYAEPDDEKAVAEAQSLRDAVVSQVTRYRPDAAVSSGLERVAAFTAERQVFPGAE